MAKIARNPGTTSQIVEVVAYDSTANNGARKTGLNNTNVTCYYKRNSGNSSVASTVVTIATLGTFAGNATQSAFKEVDSSGMPGLYEFHLCDNGLATGADEVVYMLTGNNFIINPVEVDIHYSTVGNYANNQDPATLVLGANAANWNNAGTIGQKINTAGSASDPWTAALPGNYANGTAGAIIGGIPPFPANFNTLSISGNAVAASLNASQQANIADKVLGRNLAGGADGGRTVQQALYFLRNKWTANNGTLTVFQVDDTTSSWTATISADALAQPVVGSDPA